MTLKPGIILPFPAFPLLRMSLSSMFSAAHLYLQRTLEGRRRSLQIQWPAAFRVLPIFASQVTLHAISRLTSAVAVNSVIDLFVLTMTKAT